MDELTYKANDDGTISIQADGKDIRYAKESDLLAVKGGSEAKKTEWENEKVKLSGQITDFQTKLAEANRLREETHQTLLQEQAEKEKLVKSQTDYDAIKTKAGELQVEIDTHKASIGELEKEVTDRIRHALVNFYGVSEDDLKDHNLEQLRGVETAARLIGPKPKTTYDGGPPPGGGGSAETQMERARRLMAEAKNPATAK